MELTRSWKLRKNSLLSSQHNGSKASLLHKRSVISTFYMKYNFQIKSCVEKYTKFNQSDGHPLHSGSIWDHGSHWMI